MKDSKKFLILIVLGILCYTGYVILVCFRGPCLTDFIAMSIHMFLWLFVSLVPDYIKLKRIEKSKEIDELLSDKED